MKNLITLFLIGSSLFSLAQEKEGIVLYEATSKIEINFDGDERMENVKSMLPSSRTSKKQLLFSAEATLFTNYEDEEDDDSAPVQIANESGGAVIKMEIVEPHNKVYRSLTDNIVIEKREFMGKNFLIRDELSTPWKLTGEQKQVLDYLVQQAVWEDSSRRVVAWFAPQIPISSGPEDFGGLPGLILEVDIDDGRQLIAATEIKFYPLKKSDLIKAPTKGKEVSREEFTIIQKEKMKEMNELGGGNRVIIRTNH